jgi:hypothetical protein
MRSFITFTPRRTRYAGYVACMEEMRNAYSISVGKHDGIDERYITVDPREVR